MDETESLVELIFRGVLVWVMIGYLVRHCCLKALGEWSVYFSSKYLFSAIEKFKFSKKASTYFFFSLGT